jgi:hypothetical protein
MTAISEYCLSIRRFVSFCFLILLFLVKANVRNISFYSIFANIALIYSVNLVLTSKQILLSFVFGLTYLQVFAFLPLFLCDQFL